MGDSDDESLKVISLPPGVLAAILGEEEPVEVLTPFDPNFVPLPIDPPPEWPMQESASYTIRTTPPDGAVSSSDGPQTVDHYDNAIFFLGLDGHGTFTFRGSQGFRVVGSGKVTVDEVRTEFLAPNRELRGVFNFPRNGQTGEVKLTNGSEQLVARATVGVSID